MQCAAKAVEFAEIAQTNDHYALKVIQSERFWYQSKANLGLPISYYHIYFHAVVCSSFFFLFFSSSNVSHRRLDVCHTSTHGVALVRI